MLKRRLICPSTPDAPRHSEASVVFLPDGTLFLAWSKFTASAAPDERLMSSDNASAHIAAMISADDGCTWHDERILVENKAGLNVMSPALVRLANGRLGMAYSFRESMTRAYRLFRHSNDDGQTWSDPIYITRNGYKTGCHDHITVLENGRIIVPLHCTDNWEAHYLHVRVAYSNDHGQTWQMSHSIKLPRVEGMVESGCMEPDVVQRSDGSLLMIMRTAMGTIFKSESLDNGETWSTPRSMEVIAPIAPARIVRIPSSDDLALIWNWTYDPNDPLGGRRDSLAVALSHNGGQSWPIEKRHLLEKNPAYVYAYPSCLPRDDHLLLTYYIAPAAQGLGHQRELVSMRVPYSAIYQKNNAKEE